MPTSRTSEMYWLAQMNLVAGEALCVVLMLEGSVSWDPDREGEFIWRALVWSSPEQSKLVDELMAAAVEAAGVDLSELQAIPLAEAEKISRLY